ncbi:prepilin-type N-terminal cleavage/methylation domain-containing protein [Photobacterium carnosum]|uniref:pilin n=1 Tax=Photobacterium carnosum TaxID=2023717 RepID=UPI001C902404|nr:prepilin-type N-terminal cleavage/methylation domain-containing protein [Photobacterium carnosum]MBY3788505.1 prepilin-type N-terminal cleavage/methylation domain-containing protein [Photobacterium carnosum]MCD9533671.1 prepilin-type N-terminal cleavage/methylation domain-containing protein [Photobacterium carnosum]
MKKQQGFTLIELMIVVAIIGVLSAVAIPAYKNYVTKSEVASAMATMKALITPLEARIQEKGFDGTPKPSYTLADIGTNPNANPLGLITDPAAVTSAASSLIFTFDADSSVNGKKVTFQKNAASKGVWTCIQDTGVEIKGCPATAPTAN